MIILDNFLPMPLLRAIKATWPAPGSDHWHTYRDEHSIKQASRSPLGIPRSAMMGLELMAQIDPGKLLGGVIPETFPDLESLHGAGLHSMTVGSRLGLHLDSERHPSKPWIRDVSVVLYLDTSEGGELQAGCDEKGNGGIMIKPKTNQLVLFATRGCWHQVLPCYSERRSLCLFFWSVGESASTIDHAKFSGERP